MPVGPVNALETAGTGAVSGGHGRWAFTSSPCQSRSGTRSWSSKGHVSTPAWRNGAMARITPVDVVIEMVLPVAEAAGQGARLRVLLPDGRDLPAARSR